MEIWQMVEAARGPDGEMASGIETEKINPWLSAISDVGPYVEFGETRQAGDGRKSASADSTDPERDNTNPALPVKLIEWQPGRDE